MAEENLPSREIDGRTYALREIYIDDHEWLVELHNDPKVLHNVTDPKPITIDSHIKWWVTVDGVKDKRFIFTVNGERVGIVKMNSIDRMNSNCVLGADIHVDHRGNGYAKHMWGLMLDYCFDELELYRVSLTVADFNEIGRRIYERLGFKEEGRLIESLYRDGRYWDQVCMYLLRADRVVG